MLFSHIHNSFLTYISERPSKFIPKITDAALILPGNGLDKCIYLSA